MPKEDRTDRRKVNAAVAHQAELRRNGRTAWLYLNDYDHGTQRKAGDVEWAKVFASEDDATKWLDQHDPEGVAWEYEIEGGQRQTSVWIYLADESSRAIGDSSWAKLFASKQAAEKWLNQTARNGKIWEYPIEE